MEIEKNNIASENKNEEEEVVFSTGKSEPQKAQPVKTENTEVKTEAKAEPAAVSFGSAGDPDEAEGVVFAETGAGVKRHATKQVRSSKKKAVTIPIIIGSVVLFSLAVSGIVFAVSYNRNTVPAIVPTDSSVVLEESSKESSEEPSSEENSHSLPVIRTDEAEIKTINTASIVFGEGVTVSGVDLTGKTLSEAYEAMQDRLLELRDTINITISCDGNDMHLTEDDFSFDTDLPDVLIQAYHYSRGELDNPTVEAVYNDGKMDFTVRSVINADSIGGAVKKVAKKFDIQPVDAHVESFEPTKTEKFTYADGSDGYLIDQDLVKKNIEDILVLSTKSGAFKISTVKTPFKKTLADVKANTKLIASHCTTAANVWASNFNMELAIKTANGTVVQPGETFSFNTMTGNTTNGSLGYVESTAIVNGKYEQQYGGGICQASTTIYLAALKADMTVVERYGHLFASAYADRGLDATVDYGNLDMRFRNDKDYPIYIATYVYDYYGNGMDEIMVEIYGPLSTEYDEIVPVGWVTWAGDKTYGAKGAKVYFKDGKEVKREFTPGSSYEYHYDSYSSVAYLIPGDTENGPSVSPTYSTPRVFSPGGCGSNAPIEYGTAAKVLKEAKKANEAQNSKPESSAADTSSAGSSAEESVTTISEVTE